MQLTTVIDCTGANLALVNPPPGAFMAGYATGIDGVPWTAEQFARHPGALRFDQWPAPTDAGHTADAIDVEKDAVPIAQVPNRVKAAQMAYKGGARPGQRWPAVYVEQSELTPVANQLVAQGLKDNVPLFLTEPMPEHAAIDILNNSGGPFPIIGVQYQFQTLFNVSLISTAWLNDVSVKQPASQPGPGTQTGWRFCSKCQGLFWGPGESVSVCPRGAQHDGSQSHEYTLGFAR